MNRGIIYQPRQDAAPEAERATLANIYRFIIDCHAKRNAASVSSTNGGDAMKGSKNDRASTDYTRT
jgi:hypothetical protein